MQAEMNMLFGELLLASKERQVAILLLMGELNKGMNNRIGLRMNSLINEIGDEITTKPKEEVKLQVV